MKVSILTPDLSHNCLGRAYFLAKILQRHYKVEIVGPILGDGIWEPISDDKSVTYKSVKMRGCFKPYWQIKKLVKKIDGDILYAQKPLFTSFVTGLLIKASRRKPLILDIDDWQIGLIKERYTDSSFFRRLEFLAFSTLFFYKVSSCWNNLISEKLTRFADEITVSNHFLQKKFGGTIIWHGRDTTVFDPEGLDKNLFREKYGIEKNKKVVMFLGTPRTFKGLEDLAKSIEIIKNRDVLLAIAGLDYKDPYCLNLIKTIKNRLGEERFIYFGLQPFEKVPVFLSMSDIIVIPQKKNLATIGQIPAKIFDAMAMAKPVIATNVSDLPEILNGCGWIVEPECPEQLVETIQNVLNNPEKAEEIGLKARQKCIEKYSLDSVEKDLLKVFVKYE